MGFAVAALEVKTAVRAFYLHGLPHSDFLAQIAGKVSEGFDEEGNSAIFPIRTGDGERVRTLNPVEGHKGELPRTVTGPCRPHVAGNFGDVPVWCFDRGDHAANLATTTNSAGQG